MNGEESEAKKIISSIQEQATSAGDDAPSRKHSDAIIKDRDEGEASPDHTFAGHESDVTQYTDSSDADQKVPNSVVAPSKPEAEAGTPRRRSTRARKSTKEK